jgi:hypothetical protein
LLHAFFYKRLWQWALEHPSKTRPATIHRDNESLARSIAAASYHCS